MRLNRRTSLCLAVKAGWGCFLGMYRIARKARVYAGDTIGITWTVDIKDLDGSEPWHQCKAKR